MGYGTAGGARDVRKSQKLQIYFAAVVKYDTIKHFATYCSVETHAFF